MTKFKLFFTAIILSSFSVAFSQNNNKVFMKWKLKPGETIVYKTVMQDDSVNNDSFSFKNIFKGAGDSDSSEISMQKIVKQINEFAAKSTFTSYLTETKKGIIDIAIKMKQENQSTGADTSKIESDLKKYQALVNKMNSGIMLRGAIDEDGTIQSFYTKTEQKNLLATFFELPGKEIKEGDSWPLTINLISMDQNFTCDSSFVKNIVTAVHITEKSGDRIVTLKYDIMEYVHGDFITPFNNNAVESTMKFTYVGVADFSINKGRWIDFTGIMAGMSSGIMSSHMQRKFALVEQ